MNTKHFARSALNLLVALWMAAITSAPAQTGIPLWTNRFNGASNSHDYPAAVAVAANGTVFVTGYSGTTRTAPFGYDYATAAYSSAGVPLWTNRFNGTGNHTDQAYAAAVDSENHVIVTGSSSSTGTGFDYVTIKYSGSGVPLWTNRYNGPGNSSDGPNAVAVDGSNNVIVTGTSSAGGFASDYATIKYSSEGIPFWTNRYDGPANRDDYANAVAVDSAGNVLVTGYSSDAAGVYDYATVAYSSAGVPLWTNRYNGPANGADQAEAVAVDGSGNVFVTGHSPDALSTITIPDYATVAYSSTGIPLWTNRYDGGNVADYARAVAVDSSGNVIVTGESPSGVGGVDYVTIQYSGAGVPLWTNRYDGGLADYGRAVAVDSSGNVFVTGFSRGTSSRDDFATVAYSSAGVPLWTNRYNGPVNAADSPQYKSCLAVGPNGTVYVTGESAGSDAGMTTADYATIAYSGAIVVVVPIRLNHQILGNQLILSWSGATFSLQSAPLVQGAYTNIASATSPHTNDFSEAQRYFRLIGD